MSQLIISEHREGDAVTFDLIGDVIFGESNTTLRTAIRDSLREGNNDITLNLEDVIYLDSSGIGELISALTAINRDDGRLVLLNPTERILHLLQISKLTEIFEIEYSDNRAAGA